jgi:3-hydroxybutyryl-CoA dehydratase
MKATALLNGQPGDLQEGADFTTRGRTITEADLISFSALTGDWHPQHSDADWAANSRFEKRVAHGMLVLSYAIGLMPFDPERVVALRGLEAATFKRPVAIGDTIRVRCQVEGSRALDNATDLVGLRCRVLNQDGRVVALARLQAVCRTSDGGSAPVDGDGYWPEESLRLSGGETFL